MRGVRRRSHRVLRIGIVCPYSFDAPGGVQFHVRDLAEALQAAGHEVSVLAPSSDDTELPDVVTAAGRAVPVP
jgi:phosphatidylinositol alpha-mannosyltransferase